MPTPVLRSIAKKAHKDLSTAESAWSEAKEIAAKEGKPSNWALIVSITKKKLGLAKAFGLSVNPFSGKQLANTGDKPYTGEGERTIGPDGEFVYTYPGNKAGDSKPAAEEEVKQERQSKVEDVSNKRQAKIEEDTKKRGPKLVVDPKKNRAPVEEELPQERKAKVEEEPKKREPKLVLEPTKDRAPALDDQNIKKTEPTLVLTASGKTTKLTQDKIDSLRLQDTSKLSQLSEEEWVARYKDLNNIYTDSKKSYKDRVKEALKYDNDLGILDTGSGNRDWISKEFFMSIPEEQLSEREAESLKDLSYGDLIQVKAPELLNETSKSPYATVHIIGEVDGQYLVKWKETMFHSQSLEYKDKRIAYIKGQLEELNTTSDKNRVTKFLEELSRSLVGQREDLKLERVSKQNELDELLSLNTEGLSKEQKDKIARQIGALRDDIYKIEHGVKVTTKSGGEKTFLVNKEDIRLKPTELKRGKQQDKKNQARRSKEDIGKDLLKNMGYTGSPLMQIETLQHVPLESIAKDALKRYFNEAGLSKLYEDDPEDMFSMLEEIIWKSAAKQAYGISTGESVVPENIPSEEGVFSQKKLTSTQYNIDTHVRSIVDSRSKYVAACFSKMQGETAADSHALSLYSEAEGMVHEDRAKFEDSYNSFRSYLSPDSQSFYDGISSGDVSGDKKPTEITNIEEAFDTLRMLGEKGAITAEVIQNLIPKALINFATDRIEDFKDFAYLNPNRKVPQARVNIAVDALLSMGNDLQMYNQHSDGWYSNMAKHVKQSKLNWCDKVAVSYSKRISALTANMDINIDPQAKTAKLVSLKNALSNMSKRKVFYQRMPDEQWGHTAERALTTREGKKQSPGVEAAAAAFANDGKSIDEVNSLKGLSKMVSSKTRTQYSNKELRAKYDSKVETSLKHQGLTPDELSEVKDYYFNSAIHMRKGMIGEPPEMSTKLQGMVANKFDSKITDFMLSQYNVLFEQQKNLPPNKLRDYTVDTEMLTSAYMKMLGKGAERPSKRDLMAYNTDEDYEIPAIEHSVEDYEDLRYGQFSGDLSEMDDMLDADLDRDSFVRVVPPQK